MAYIGIPQFFGVQVLRESGVKGMKWGVSRIAGNLNTQGPLKIPNPSRRAYHETAMWVTSSGAVHVLPDGTDHQESAGSSKKAEALISRGVARVGLSANLGGQLVVNTNTLNDGTLRMAQQLIEKLDLPNSMLVTLANRSAYNGGRGAKYHEASAGDVLRAKNLQHLMKGRISESDPGHAGRKGHQGGSLPGKQEHSAKELKQLRAYAEHYYGPVNEALRSHSQKQIVGVRDGIKLMDSAIDKSPPFLKDTLLFRGVVLAKMRGDETDAERKFFSGLLKKGSVVSDPGFSSTSTDPKSAYHFTGEGPTGIVMAIHASAGTKAFSYSSDSKAAGASGLEKAGEQEFLLPRGSKFRVVSVSAYRPEGTQRDIFGKRVSYETVRKVSVKLLK